MSAEFEEQLSSLIDGETGSDASRFALRRLEGSAELKQSWSRLHLAGDLLARRAVMPASFGFAERVAQALEAESLARSGKPGKAGWLRYAGGAALAASVALVALMMVPAPNSGDATLPAVAVERSLPATVRSEAIASSPRPQAVAAAQQAALGYSQGRIPVLPALVVMQDNLPTHSGHVRVPEAPAVYVTAPRASVNEAPGTQSDGRAADEPPAP